MEELIVEGITPEDFLLIKKILETYKVDMYSDITLEDIRSTHAKISDIVKCFEDK